MREHTATARLKDAFAALPDEPDAAVRENLRRSVHAFVDASKQRGAPVERVIIALKEIAAEAGIRSSTEMVRLRARLRPRDQILLDVVRWTVERYFEYQRPSGEGFGNIDPRKRPPRGGHEMAPFRPDLVSRFAQL